MHITVILCTYDRSESLAKTLNGVAASILPESVDWEILVVDNNSKDQTREVVDEARRQYPGRIRYLFERRQGKSLALNSAIREAQGDVLAFVDDDVTVEPTWLRSLTAPLASREWAGVAGRILPASTFSPPSWFWNRDPYPLGGALFAHFDLGDESRELDRPPYGANMAFRREMFEKYGCFRTDLGPRPGCAIRNEDTEFGRRLLKAGERLQYEPSAVVYHIVPQHRLNKKYFLDWWFEYGRAEICEVGRKPDVWGVPRRYPSIVKLIATVLLVRSVRWLLSVNPQKRFFWKTRTWTAAGQIAEIYREWRDKERDDHVPQKMERLQAEPSKK